MAEVGGGGGLLLFLLWWTIVKCSLNLETPPFVFGALLTQAVKLGASLLVGDWMGPLWGGGAHTEAIEGIEMPLFCWVVRKGGRSCGPPGISEASALTAFPGLRFLQGSPDLSGWARSAWTVSSLEPPAVETWCLLCASESWTLFSSTFAGCCPPWAYL